MYIIAIFLLPVVIVYMILASIGIINPDKQSTTETKNTLLAITTTPFLLALLSPNVNSDTTEIKHSHTITTTHHPTTTYNNKPHPTQNTTHPTFSSKQDDPLDDITPPTTTTHTQYTPTTISSHYSPTDLRDEDYSDIGL